MLRKEVVTLTPGEVRMLLGAAPDAKFKALLTLAVTTGMRQGELLGLRWKDVSLSDGTVSVRSNRAYTAEGYVLAEVKPEHSKRHIRIPTHTVRALALHREEQDTAAALLGPDWNPMHLVFPNQYGRLWNSSDVRTVFERTLAAAQLPEIRFHDLRYTAATLLLERGIHPKIVSEILGHSTIAITLDTYSHVTLGMQNVAVQAMDSILETPEGG